MVNRFATMTYEFNKKTALISRTTKYINKPKTKVILASSDHVALSTQIFFKRKTFAWDRHLVGG